MLDEQTLLHSSLVEAFCASDTGFDYLQRTGKFVGARLPIEFFSRPQCYLPPYAVHDPNWGYSNSLGQGSCSTNKLLISSSSSDLSSSKCEGLLRNTLETAISEPCRPATPQSCDASFQTRFDIVILSFLVSCYKRLKFFFSRFTFHACLPPLVMWLVMDVLLFSG